MAGSGWCHHPLRKTTGDLLILVRRNELACRDQWSKCLWQEGVWSQTLDTLTADAVGGGRPVAPASEDEIAALVRTAQDEQSGGDGGRTGQDVVLGEARLVHDRTPPWRRDEPPPPPRDRDARAALKRAHEAHRERRRAETQEQALLIASALVQGEAAPVCDGAAGPEGFGVGSQGANVDHELTEIAPVIAGESQPALDRAAGVERESAPNEVAVAPTVAAARGDDPAGVAEAAAVSIPTAGDPPSPFPDPVESAAEAADAGWWSASSAGADALSKWAADSESGEDDAGEPSPAVAPLPWNLSDGPVDADLDYAEAPTSSFPATSPWAVASAGMEPADLESAASGLDHRWEGWADDDRLARVHPAPVIREPIAEPIAWRGPADDAEPVVVLDDQQSSSASDEPAAHVMDAFAEATTEEVLTPSSRPVIPLLPAGSVAPGVPRICRTCRDFRPVDNGDSGWCANEWAFATRRVVSPDDAAPCESSIGSWWLPTDELCLADADVSTHGQPTPILDRWLPHRQEPSAERRQS